LFRIKSTHECGPVASVRYWLLSLVGVLVVGFSTAAPARGANRAQGSDGLASQASAQQVALGRALFFDTALSADGEVACASCHRPERAFADDVAISRGAHHRQGTRNAPSLLDLARGKDLFWDGRRTSLEALILDPLLHPNEHAMASLADIVQRVRQRHAEAHSLAFAGREVSADTIAQAVAAYVRTLESGESPFDRFHFSGDTTALTEAQQRGLKLFVGRAECNRCHTLGPTAAPFTDGMYHAGETRMDLQPRLHQVARELALLPEADRFAAVASREEVAALGRFVVTLRPEDIGRFRTPNLRNVALTAPYMHDGSVPTLREAVERELYYRAGNDARLGTLTPRERADLVDFLEALTSTSLPEQALPAPSRTRTEGRALPMKRTTP
jgi:cytochrome c peroxidase